MHKQSTVDGRESPTKNHPYQIVLFLWLNAKMPCSMHPPRAQHTANSGRANQNPFTILPKKKWKENEDSNNKETGGTNISCGTLKNKTFWHT